LALVTGEIDLELIADAVPARIWQQWKTYFDEYPSDADRADMRTMAEFVLANGADTETLDVSLSRPYFKERLSRDDEAAQLLAATKEKRSRANGG
jgi:hypothetical protein